jgi:tetratricopeptide (TPR) repeat protein
MEEGTSAPVNFVDVKLHGITGVPAAWAQDSGPAPMFGEHVFRYEVDVTIGPQKETFRNGRLLSAIPLYSEFILSAALPPPTERVEDKAENSATLDAVPAAVEIPRVGGGAQVSGGGGDAQDSADALAATLSQAPQILWVISADADLQEQRDEESKKAAGGKPPPKGAAAKGAAPAAAPGAVVEAVRPTAPTAKPQCVVRFPLSVVSQSFLEDLVEKSVALTLTFRRVLRAGLPADWEDANEQRFQATIPLSLAPLAEPGSLGFTANVPLVAVPPEPVKDDEKGQKGGKAAKGAAKKAKGGAPSILTDELDPNEPHPYSVNQTSAKISISFTSSLTRLPAARPRPDLQPFDLIPKRLRPPHRPAEATKQFSAELESVIQKVIRDFRAQNGGSSVCTDERRAAFLNFLQSSGQSHAYKQALIPAVQSIVREKFIRKPNPSKEEVDRVCNELYAHLIDHMHLTMQRLFNNPTQTAASTAQALDGCSSSERWKRRAQEAEVMQEFAVAAKYHQERLGSVRPGEGDEQLPAIWTEYAEFCLRVRDTLRAEQGYREALALDFAYIPALLGYGTLLLSCNRYREAEVFLQSAVDVDPSTVTWGCLALFYDMQLLSTEDDAANTEKRAVFTRESKYALGQACRGSGVADETPKTPSDVYEIVGSHLISIYLEDLANVALAKCSPSQKIELLFAKLFHQTQQSEESIIILSQITKAQPQNAEVRMLFGDVYAACGKTAEAEQQYDAALRIDPKCGNGPAFVRLGNMYVGLGKYKDALAAFIQGAEVWPCGVTWLGVGIAYYRLEDMARAEQALNESNILNNLNPKTWAYIALVCLRQKRDDEGDQAFNQAVKQGIDDPYLITEIGFEQNRLGRYKIAEACYKRAIGIRPDCNTYMQLARTLCSMKRFAEAAEAFDFVVENSTSETQRIKAEEQKALIPTA